MHRVSYHTISVTATRAKELEDRLRGLISEYERASSTGIDARRFGVLGVLAPLPDEVEA